MKPILSALVSIPALGALAGALVLAPVIWLFAPALLGVEATWLLALLAAIPVLIWLAVLVVVARRRAGRDAALVAGVTAEAETAKKADAAATALSAEEKQVAQRLAEALKAMREAGGGKGGHLYERPWYVIIGPPGSGKTTAIQNSGLDFPLAAGRVPGVGGTRNCDWWIAEQAVLIDTAGRYTTQDSDASADKAGWDRFLGLLRAQRPRQPLNGVVVAFGADMLSKLDATAREGHARAVRTRIRELEQKLGQRLPVYFLVSKADLVIGFTEYFDDLDREARAQVWGVTFPPEAGPEGHAGSFAQEFGALVTRLQDRLLDRLQAERGAEQRARIGGFPAQFASLEAPLAAFVQAAFGGSKLDPAPFLRGVYFTSGTQEGTPIDRLTGALARSFGLDPRRPAAIMGQKGRSYFLGRLLREVVFNEARLAARDRGQARRGQLVQAGAWAAALLAILGGGAWGWSAMNGEAARAQALATAIAQAEAGTQGVTLDRIAPTDDIARTLPYLEGVRALPAAAKAEGGGLGLSQEAKLVEGAELAYKRALDRVLLPRLLARLETQMRAGMQRPDYLYEATRVYLMLGRQGPLDRALVREWMDLDWQQAWPGAANQPFRDALLRHLDALLAQDFAGYPVDGALVDEARRVFSRLPMAERVYTRLRSAAANTQPWRPAETLGPAGSRWFGLANGRPLAEAAVPGLYTVEGLHRALIPRLPQAILEAAGESWVLGPEAAAAIGDPRQLEAAVLRLYAQDYVRAWEAMLTSLVLPPFRDLNQAAEALNLLGAPNSPMRDLLRAVARQLSPGTAPEPLPGATAVAGAAAAAVQQAAGPAASRIAQAVGAVAGPSPASVVAGVVEERFRPLREAAGQPLDGILGIVNDMFAQVARMASAPPGAAPPPPAAAALNPGQRLLAEAQRAPEPLSRWLRAMAQSSAVQQAGGARAAIAAAGGQALAPFCRGTEGRFPFSRAANAPDMPLDDFVRLFAPNGVLDQFFAQHLRNFVDTTARPWRPVAVDGLPPPVSAADVAQFQRAAAIRDAFFPAALPGQAAGTLRFELVPTGLDPGATGATLEVAGNAVQIARTPQGARPVPMQWPAPGPVALTFDPAAPAGALTADGPWAALRLVARGQLVAAGQPDRFRLTLRQGDRAAEFELRAASIVNPFAMRELAEFRCPALPAP